MVIYLAGLQSVPQHLYEAASLDGASVLAKFRHVTIPMLTPVIFYNLIMGIIGSFQVFTQAFVMTNGGPVNSTLFYVLYLFRQAFNYYHMGYASAMAWVLFVIILVLTMLVFRSSAAWVYYEGDRRK
jgi:multiple sugar transport system permease protein